VLVSDVMTTRVISITPDTSVNEAMRILKENKIRRLPVTDGHGNIIGIVTEKDLKSAMPSMATTLDIWEIHAALEKIKVEEIMTKNVITVRDNEPLEGAAKIMAEKKIGALPVLDEDNHLVGIITESDIFRTFVKMLGANRDGIRYTFLSSDKPGVISELAQRVKSAGGNIIAISSFPQDDKYLIVIKVAGLDHDKFVESLRDCTAKLLYFHK